MMYDRPYMTNTQQDRDRKILMWLIGTNLAIWVLQSALVAVSGRDYLAEFLGFGHDSLLKGFIWTPLTYAFLHDPGSILHIGGNMLGVYFLGKALLPLLGQKRFLQLYGLSAILGSMVFFGVSFVSGGFQVLGASAAVMGLLIFFACLYPNTEMQILLFFILPVRVKPKYLAWIVLFVSGTGMLFNELIQHGSPIAHSAHLGGMLGGYLFFKYIYLPNPYVSVQGLDIKLPKLFKKAAPQNRTEKYRYKVDVSQTPDLKKEVDRILDKINSKGFGALSPEEKKTLDEARDLLRKR